MAFAGKLNEPIKVWNFKRGKNEFGEEVDYSPLNYSEYTAYDPDDTESNCTYYDTRAKVIYTGGIRNVLNNEVQTPYTKSFIVRAYVPVTDESWISWKDTYYRVTSFDISREYNEITITTEKVNE